MASKKLRRKYSTLQRAASVLFALTSVIPLLVFAYCLYRLGALEDPYYQLSLGLSLFAALLGYVMFRNLVTRMSRLLRILGRARTPAPTGDQPAAPPARTETVSREASMVPGLGHIQELDDLVEILGAIWKPEALPYMGRRVQVSTRDRPIALVGTLVDVTDEGLLLEQDGHRLPVSYPRIAAIEAEPAPSADDIELVTPPEPPPPDEPPRPARFRRGE